jgi:hypothetical protein
MADAGPQGERPSDARHGWQSGLPAWLSGRGHQVAHDSSGDTGSNRLRVITQSFRLGLHGCHFMDAMIPTTGTAVQLPGCGAGMSGRTARAAARRRRDRRQRLQVSGAHDAAAMMKAYEAPGRSPASTRSPNSVGSCER